MFIKLYDYLFININRSIYKYLYLLNYLHLMCVITVFIANTISGLTDRQWSRRSTPSKRI